MIFVGEEGTERFHSPQRHTDNIRGLDLDWYFSSVKIEILKGEFNITMLLRKEGVFLGLQAPNGTKGWHFVLAYN